MKVESKPEAKCSRDTARERMEKDGAREFTRKVPAASQNTSLLRFMAQDSGSERIGPLYSEARLADLRGIRRGNAGELGPDVVDDVKIAVRAVVIPQTNVGADALCVRGVQLN